MKTFRPKPSYLPLMASPYPLHLTSSVYDIVEYVRTVFHQELVAKGLSVAEKKITIRGASESDISTVVWGTSSAPRSVQDGRDLFIHDESVGLRLHFSADMVEIVVSGDPTRVSTLVNHTLPEHFTPLLVQVKWMFKPGDYVKLPIDGDTLPQDVFYPSLAGESLTNYYTRYMSSRANVLVLIGPPGTGKTSFIRGLLHTTRSNAILSYDSALLEQDEIFAEFMSGDESVMVLEDADTFLSSRAKSGNTIMHKFLNVGDGLLSTRGKKLIFTTNLPSIRDVDPALLRPGRCFDVMRFGKLTASQARAIRDDYPADGADLTLAELMNGQATGPEPGDGVGFIRS